MIRSGPSCLTPDYDDDAKGFIISRFPDEEFKRIDKILGKLYQRDIPYFKIEPEKHTNTTQTEE